MEDSILLSSTKKQTRVSSRASVNSLLNCVIMTDRYKNLARMDAALTDKAAIVRVFGRATFDIAPALKQFGLSVLKHGSKNLILDMENCDMIDSTFVGTITGLATKFRQNKQAVFALNLTDKKLNILRTLGADRVLQCRLQDAPRDELNELLRRTTIYYPLSHAEQDSQDTMKNMLEAHNSLVDVDPANLMKFKDVIDLLSSDKADHDVL